MIIVKIKGGLGNQLFQYSIGRYLSLKLNTPLKLNIVGYEYDKSRPFELGYFKIPEIDTDISSLLSSYFRYYNEKHFCFDPDYISISTYTYLDGYWQSEKYFNSIRPILLKDLEVKDEFIIPTKEIANEILNSKSVAVHIRRGDYLAPHYFKNFGILSIDYYHKAIELLKERVENLRFYFFSDDIEWVQNNFQVNNTDVLISKKVTRNSIEDFYLMSKCNHHIIANSTFSWWTAWLCQRAEKIIIGPKKWFKSDVPNTKDILPQSWLSC